MSSTPIIVTPETEAAASSSKTRKTGSSLGKDEFLKLLTIQLANQDPSNPMDNTAFIAQMAQFSSLEQMTNVYTAIEKMNTSISKMNINQYANAIGKKITWKDLTAAEGTSSGIVTGVASKDGSSYYLVGSEKIPVDSVNEIKQTS